MNQPSQRPTLAQPPIVGAATSPRSLGIFNALRTPKGWRTYVATALMAAGLGSLVMPKVCAQDGGFRLAPNGQPWLEGNYRGVLPKVNADIRDEIAASDKLHGMLRMYALTNTATVPDLSESCAGVPMPALLQEATLYWLNHQRDRQGLKEVVWGHPSSHPVSEQDMHDTALYQSKLMQQLRIITHFPATYTNVSHYGCLTTNIQRASTLSIISASSDDPLLPILQSRFYPVEHINNFISDNSQEYGHRTLLFDPNAVSFYAGATPVRYSTNNLNRFRDPISFHERTTAMVGYVHVEMKKPGLIQICDLYPAPGVRLLTYGQDRAVDTATDFELVTVQVSAFDSTKSTPQLTIVEESNGNRVISSRLFSIRDDLIGGRFQTLAWQRTSFPSYPQEGFHIMRFTISNLTPRDATNASERVSITWRVASFHYSGATSVIEQGSNNQILVRYPFSARVDKRMPPRATAGYYPWKLQAASDLLFSSPVDVESRMTVAPQMDENGMYNFSIDPTKYPDMKFFRVRQMYEGF